MNATGKEFFTTELGTTIIDFLFVLGVFFLIYLSTKIKK
jgi:hypothetical protein